MSGKLVRIGVDGVLNTTLVVEKEPALSLLQKLVGGYVEPVCVTWEGVARDAYVDEGGKNKQLAMNDLASTAFAKYHGGVIDVLCGPVVVWVPAPRMPLGKVRRARATPA